VGFAEHERLVEIHLRLDQSEREWENQSK
jgi:hypothetical protein